MGNDHRIVFCATKWSGFADEDIGVAVSALQDVSNFPKIADRTQQGFLNQLFLARLVFDSLGRHDAQYETRLGTGHRDHAGAVVPAGQRPARRVHELRHAALQNHDPHVAS